MNSSSRLFLVYIQAAFKVISAALEPLEKEELNSRYERIKRQSGRWILELRSTKLLMRAVQVTCKQNCPCWKLSRLLQLPPGFFVSVVVADLTRPFYARVSLREGPNFTLFLTVSVSIDLAVPWPSLRPTFGFQEDCHFSSVSLCK